MTAPTPKTPKTTQAPSVADQWREVQEAQKKRDRMLAELNTAIARYGAAEIELGLATNRFDRMMAAPEQAPAIVKP